METRILYVTALDIERMNQGKVVYGYVNVICVPRPFFSNVKWFKIEVPNSWCESSLPNGKVKVNPLGTGKLTEKLQKI